MSLLHVVLMDVAYRLDFNISQAFSPYLLRYSVLHIIRFKQGLSKLNELKHIEVRWWVGQKIQKVPTFLNATLHIKQSLQSKFPS